MSSSAESLPSQAATRPRREPASHDSRALYQLLLVMAILLFTLAIGLYDGQRYGQVYIFGYIITIVIAISGPRRHNRPWSDLGVKRGFVKDFGRVWYYFGIDALLFQILPPTLGIALLFGYYHEEIQHVTSRISVNFGSLEGVMAVGSLLAAALVLTLVEEVVFRVTIQERLSWFIGTPAAILFASVIFGLVHAVGTAGSLQVILTDVVGVAIDGVFFGIIYAKTHNLALTWATHYAADVVGLIALLLVL